MTAHGSLASVYRVMVAEYLDTNTAPPLTRPRPRTVPYYGISSQEAAEGEEEYYSDEDFDIEEALEQLDAAIEDRKSIHSQCTVE